MKKQITFVLASALFGTTALAPAAMAQDAASADEQVRAVYERSRPDYDAPGIRTGSFLFYPKVEAGLKHDTNIYAQESGVTKDFLAVIKPSFNLVSDWNSDYFSLMADANIGRYFDEGSEDYEDFKVALSGRKDISRGTSITADASYSEGHEDRGSPDADGANETPVKFATTSAKLGFKRDLSVLSLAVDGSYEKRDFDDVDRIGGGVANNDDRDRDRLRGQIRFGYEMADGYEAFLRGSMDRVEYDNSKEDGGPQRNSDGYEVVGGAAFDLTGTAKGEFYIGYMKRAYDSNSLPSTDGINFGAELLWNMTGLTSFTVAVRRSIDETTVGGLDADGDPTDASGILSTNVFGRVEHELRRNVLMFASGSYTMQKFQRTTREDDLIDFSAGAEYLMNRNVRVGLKYDYKYRDTNEVNQDYSRHAVLVNLKAQW